MTPAEEKEVEANAAGLQEVKPTSPPSDTSSEELPPFRKRSRRREILFISIAVVVGLGLIAVLVYFSAKNAIGEPEAVTMTTGLPSTTELYYYDEEYETGGLPPTAQNEENRANLESTADALVKDHRGLLGKSNEDMEPVMAKPGTGVKLLSPNAPPTSNETSTTTDDGGNSETDAMGMGGGKNDQVSLLRGGGGQSLRGFTRGAPTTESTVIFTTADNGENPEADAMRLGGGMNDQVSLLRGGGGTLLRGLVPPPPTESTVISSGENPEAGAMMGETGMGSMSRSSILRMPLIGVTEESEPHQQTRIANGGAGNSNLREAAVPTTPEPMARTIPGEPMARTNPGVGVARGGNIPPGGAGGVLRSLPSPTTPEVPTFGLRGNFPERPTQHPDLTSQPDAPEQTNTEAANKTKPPAVQTKILVTPTLPSVEIKTTGKPAPPPDFKTLRRAMLPPPPEETEGLDEINPEAAQSGSGASSLTSVKVEPAEPIVSEENQPILPDEPNQPPQAQEAGAETKPSESNTIATDPPIIKPVTSPLVPPSAPTNGAPTTLPQANGEAALQANGEAASQGDGAASTPIIGG